MENKIENSQTIDAQKEIQEYIKEKKDIYDKLINFLEKNENNEQDFDFSCFISIQVHEENNEKLKKFLQLIINIANNCHRNEFLFNKIFQIINFYEQEIKQTFSNDEIFNIFESNKKILLFLLKKKIITIDEFIYDKLFFKTEPNDCRYCHFFYPEIKNFVGEEKAKSIEKELLDIDSNIFDQFEEKREEGENDTFICSLIRKDSIKEFVEYINNKNIPLNNEITPSIFETNSLLNEKTRLIEYATFFGSIQIFQYLHNNKVEMRPCLWKYVIHSRNAELFQFLEDKKFEPSSFLECFCESIKCHHNEFVDYISDNLLAQNTNVTMKNEEVLSNILKYHNYAYFPTDFEDQNEFFYLCSNHYNKLVKLYIQKKKETIKRIISKEI